MGGDHYLNLQPGTIVNGRYEVVKCLGTGSMGMVYACRHRELAGHIVAMKVLFSEVARDEVAATRFRNEIVASYGVSHPNVVRAYEYFRDGDLIAFTMEFVGGGDIADKISSTAAIGINDIISMLTQMCSGVQAIHDAGIIHRDLKPENILLTTQGDIKITDFGIARQASGGPKLTDHGGVVGTIDYVSPEYLEKGQVDARSDIYALGVIAYEMITHESPFRGKSVIETMTMRLRSDPEAPHRLRADCPIALSNIVLKAMARDPELRYQRAREMYDDLANLAKGGPVLAGTLPTAAVSNDSNKGRTYGNGSFDQDYHEDWSGSQLEQPSSLYGGATDGGGGLQEVATRVSAPTQMLSMPQGVFTPTADDLEEFIEDATDSYSPRMDSMLSKPQAPDWYRDGRTADTPSPPSISISQGHLSTDRLKQLSGSLEEPEGSLLRTLVSSVIIFVLGFGVGWLLLRQYKPELFESALKEPRTEIFSGDIPESHMESNSPAEAQ